MQITKPHALDEDLVTLAARFRYAHDAGVIPAWGRDTEGDWRLGDGGPIFWIGADRPDINAWRVRGIEGEEDPVVALALCMGIAGPEADTDEDAEALAEMAADLAPELLRGETTMRDPGARSSAYMAGRSAFAGGVAYEDAVEAFDPGVTGAAELAAYSDFERGWTEMRDFAADEPGLIRLTPGIDLPADLPPEVADETRVQNYVLIAERECTREQIDAARQLHREWMREHGQGDPMAAAALRLRELHAAGKGKVLPIALIVAAAASVRDEGRANPGDVATQDAPRGDTGTGKGKKRKGGAAKATGPKKSKRSTAWVKRLGTTAALFRAGFGVADETLLDLIRKGAFTRLPEQIMSDPCYGFCPIDDPSTGTDEITALPGVGSDPEFVVWGLRRDAKTGCPSHRFRYEAEAEATREARAAGKDNASGARIKELTEAKKTAWYRTATPQTTVIPVVYHRPSFTFSVHSSNTADIEAATSRIRACIGGIERAPGVLDSAPADLGKTSLRAEDLTTPGGTDIPADLLLWLVGRQLGGTGVHLISEEGAKLEWWLDESVDLERSTADDKKLRVKLSGAPAEGGSLAAALADGASMREARLCMRVDERTWKLTIAAGAAKSWHLPTLTKPDGTPAGLDAAVDERLRLWGVGRELLDHLLVAFVEERADKGGWRQRMTALRAQLGIEMVKRWGWNAELKQGFLFAHMLPGEQGTLGGLAITDKRGDADEKPAKSRGGRARARAGEAAAEAK